MGIHDRDYYQDGRSRPGIELRKYSMVTLLVMANAAVFVLDMFFERGSLMNGMAVQTVTIVEPWNWWRFLTAGFAHSPDSVQHLIFNMAGLLFLGRPVEARYGKQEFLLFYLVAVVLGNVAWSGRMYFSGQSAIGMVDGTVIVPSALGASGAVTAVVMLFIFLYPKQTLLLMMVLPVPAWLVGVLLVLTNLLQVNMTGVSGANVAYDIHLVGAALGAVYYKLGWNFSRWWPRQLGGAAKFTRRRPKLKLHVPEDDHEADRLLDKVHREGESSLTDRERKILESYSRRMREKHR
ncbi:MAG: rhomboid family intramembrane serine protease [Planctomycetaceae bacterium]|nr:rhomboid family intramembrane serine protease [Planctomycetaceae bacterium]|tara:strand:- start:4705 stop:5583 length:879 start_codon:yes stop_codon:yes gene_type:complete